MQKYIFIFHEINIYKDKYTVGIASNGIIVLGGDYIGKNHVSGACEFKINIK